MKKVLFILIFALGGSAAMAQSSFYNSPYKSRNSGSFEKSAKLLTFSYGFPNLSNNFVGFGWFGTGFSSTGFGPVYGKFELGIMDEVGIGAQAAFSGGAWYASGRKYANVVGFHVAALGYYHFNKLIAVKALDVYAGLGLGFRNLKYDYVDNTFQPDVTDTNVVVAWKVGARYYFAPVFGVYLETGGDSMSSVNLGFTLKF